MINRAISLWTLAVSLCVLFATFGLAQDYRGRIEGIVTDQTQSVIAGASVTLVNVKTGVRTVRQSSPTGLYLFDLVDPGSYSITVEATGFGKFVQENILVQTRGDVTVNATLNPGAVQESVTVSSAPADVQFNSSSKDLTIDSKLAAETPRIDRNPFKLTLLAPSAVNTRGEMQPYHSWAANSVDLGGGTNLKNDLQVDGSPVGLGHKNSYPPNTDAVQEVVVSQNSVDAESGHSAGGLISLTTKSGTNEWHGSAFYLGRYPWLSAEADRTRFSLNAQRQNMYGGTLGNPIIKNKLFNFASLEYWQVGYPNSYVKTVPTAAEAAGDFSQSLNVDGGVRTVFDPFSTQFNPATGAVTRTPFAGNVVPKSRFDPLAASLVSSFWAPNNPGDNITGVNNYKKGFLETYAYYNFSDRADYNINDKWKVYGRVGRYHTTDIAGNPTPNNSQLYVPTGSLRAATQVSGDAIWTVSPRTVVNFHGDWHRVIDAYVAPDLGKNGWSKIWPNNNWYQSYQDASVGVPVYFPGLNIGGVGFGGPGFFWNQAPQGEAFNVKASQQRGSHYLKAGFEHRRSYGLTLVSNTSNFSFPTALTADTFVSPDTKHIGDPWASFLMGALDGTSEMIAGPAPDPHVEFYGMFFQDDWKVSRRITVNLGLRNEYETAYHDPNHFFSQAMNLSAPVPEMQANPPQMPAQALALVGNNFYKYNGLWQFTSGGHPGMWDPQKFALQPRAGVAFRIDDKTALRAGYARYLVPAEMNLNLAPVAGFETVGFLEPPFFGVTGYQYTAPLLQGVPQQTISNPYPSNNPLIPIAGKASGTNVGRGGGSDLLWYPANLKKQRNDRIDINFQRQLPGQIVASVTWFTNFGNQHYTQALNNIDPRLKAQYQNALDVSVSNPFYNYLTPTLFPGPLRNQQTVSLSSLLRPYPQYGGLYQVGVLGAGERYNSLELKAQKAFSKGYNFLFAYVYIRERNQVFFNDLDTYLNRLTWQDSDQPHHRMNIAGSWELPFGIGRSYLNNIPKVADAALGGWKVTGIWTFMSGDFPRFGTSNLQGTAYIVSGNPCVSNPTPQHWFNAAAFQPAPANTYVIRANPWQYDCLVGPKFWDLDATLSKTFTITERFHAELKMAAYNATNRLNRGDPNTDVTSSLFGQALYQGSPGGTFGAQGATYGNQSGRQVELGLKIIF
jgi:Carboxypeptidase regulatory-like domain/TonB dependent receptor